MNTCTVIPRMITSYEVASKATTVGCMTSYARKQQHRAEIQYSPDDDYELKQVVTCPRVDSNEIREMR